MAQNDLRQQAIDVLSVELAKEAGPNTARCSVACEVLRSLGAGSASAEGPYHIPGAPVSDAQRYAEITTAQGAAQYVSPTDAAWADAYRQRTKP